MDVTPLVANKFQGAHVLPFLRFLLFDKQLYIFIDKELP